MIIFLMQSANVGHIDQRQEIFENLITKNQLKNEETILFVDYSKPITEKRFFIFDNKAKKVIYSDFVGHAWSSGKNIPKKFSNTPNTRKSSLGLYRIGKKYKSKGFEFAHRLHGLSSTNNNAMKRSIVIHDVGDAATQESIVINNNKDKYFYLYSYGCFTFFKRSLKKISPFLKKGTYMIVFNSNPRI
jgi:hypothetical protein